jgi:hypothetical protein
MQPAPTYPAAPDYAAPAHAYAMPQGQYLVSRSLGVVIAAVVVIVVLLVGIVGYVFAGYAYASSRISDASTAINTATAHRSYVNTTFDLLDQQLASLDAITDDAQAKSTSGQLVSESQSMDTTVGGDDQTLATARGRLHDQQWLTTTSSGRLDAMVTRIDHARKAVSTVKSAAGDYVELGQFFQAFYQALIDGGTLIAAAKNNDLVGSVAANAAFQLDLAVALKVANAPGLPQQYHDFLAALQLYAADFAKELNARDKATYDAAHNSVVADAAKVNAVDFTGTTATIQSYYKHYRDAFNSEMDKAFG